MTAEAWAAIGIWVTAIATVALVAGVIVAWVQLRQAPRLAREQFRPYVFIDLEPNPVTPEWIDLVISNTGPLAAYDVRFEFDPPLVSTRDHATGAIAKLPMFQNKGLVSLPPNKTIRTVFEKNDDRRKSDLPKSHQVIVRYYDRPRRVHNAQLQPRSSKDLQREDVYRLDVENYQMLTYLESSKTVVTQLEKLRQAIEGMSGP